MSKLYDHLKNDSDSIRLSEAEKNAMRMRLERALFNLPGQSAPTRSPYMWMFAPRSLALAGLLAILVGTSGTAYAAEGSLPGAPLYSVKTKVIEPIKVALAPTPTAKAEVNAKIAVLRVEEAKTLAAQGALTERMAEEISTNYRAHANAALALAAEMSGEDAATSTALAPEASAPAEEAVVATLAVEVETDESGDDEPETPPVKTFAAKISLMAQSTDSSSTSTATSTVIVPAKNYKNPAPAERGSGISTFAATSTKAMFVQKIRASLMEQDKILDGINAEVKQKKIYRKHR